MNSKEITKQIISTFTNKQHNWRYVTNQNNINIKGKPGKVKR
jgi:hypothetical protein